MSRLELAKLGFKNLAPLLVTGLDESTSDRAESWLRDEVCPVVSELTDVAKFRDAVLWAPVNLSQNPAKPAMRLLQRVERLLVEFACALREAIPLVREQVRQDDRDLIQFISEQPWVELASPTDFFHPTQTLLLCVPDPGDHTVRFRQKELRDRLGDYVTQSMLARIQYWKDLLQRLVNSIRRVMPKAQSAESNSFLVTQRIIEAELKLSQAIDGLIHVCDAEAEKTLREACVVLTQVYACYAERPRLDWIPLENSWIQASRFEIRSVIRRQTPVHHVEELPSGLHRTIREDEQSLCDASVLRQVASALDTVTDLFESPENPEKLEEWARVRASLVLSKRSGNRVFWNGDPVQVDWDTKVVEWDLLWVLSLHANSPVEQRMLKNPTKHRIRGRRERLSQLLSNCQELDQRIVSVRGVGYKLEIDRSDVIVLESDGDRLVRRI